MSPAETAALAAVEIPVLVFLAALHAAHTARCRTCTRGESLCPDGERLALALAPDRHTPGYPSL